MLHSTLVMLWVAIAFIGISDLLRFSVIDEDIEELKQENAELKEEIYTIKNREKRILKKIKEQNEVDREYIYRRHDSHDRQKQVGIDKITNK